MSVNSESDNLSKKPLFRDLDPEDKEPESTEIESLCVNCGSNVSQLFINICNFTLFLIKFIYLNSKIALGDYTPSSYSHTTLQGGGINVI